VSAAHEARVAASYRRLFAEPVLRRLALADVCARLPQGMVTITLLLVAAQHASMTVAGLVVAGYTLGQAATAPLRGRLADRRGLVPVAVVCGAGYALALLALLAGSLASAPAGVLIAAAAVAGLFNPPLSPGLRSLWSAHAGQDLRGTAFALDAAVFDLAYITGPVLASGLATGLAPAAAVAALLALTGAAAGAAVAGLAAGRPLLALTLAAALAAAAGASASVAALRGGPEREGTFAQGAVDNDVTSTTARSAQ
jgi:MFS family permease